MVMNGSVQIKDYAIIGNCRTAALVSKSGSIDWCCFPHFHSPSIFAALLDSGKGCFSIQPVGSFSSHQEYIPDTNVVECSFRIAEGVVHLIDAFVVLEEEEKTSTLTPDHEILRLVKAVKGKVCMQLCFNPLPNYGKLKPVLHDKGELGIYLSYKGCVFVLQTTLEKPAYHLDEGGMKLLFEIEEGQQVYFSLSVSSQSPCIIPELPFTASERLDKTIKYWRKWISRCKYQGVYHEQVKRSALALKLLCHAPTGAIIAAATTSLPEEVGGERNWDYRYCWLRDASFTVRALVKLGYREEAGAYLQWIIHATQLTHPKLQVVYTVFGESRIREKEGDWLAGYKHSKPVRIGNAADSQFQLDVYGEVVDAVYTFSGGADDVDKQTRRFLKGLSEQVCKHWNELDDGIWEVRSGGVHHVHSKVLAWVALDRVCKMAKKYNWTEVPVEKYQRIAENIKAAVGERGYDKTLKSYTRAFDDKALDASVLVLPLVGFCDIDSPEMQSTLHSIKEGLMNKGMLYRHVGIHDGLNGDEGAFIICNFWLAENLALSGDVQEAAKVMEKMISLNTGVGLLSEEADPEGKELLGNYPQAFSHIGLINAALTLQACEAKNYRHVTA